MALSNRRCIEDSSTCADALSGKKSPLHISLNDQQYGVKKWGEGYFGINKKGNIAVFPNQKESIDLYELVQSIVKSGIALPALIRFDGILKDRVDELCRVFQKAIKEVGYKSSFQPIYPIKTNPQKHVMDVIQEAGSKYSLGLEVGSKSELLVALSSKKSETILCNGFKDAEYMELALLGTRIGKRPIIVIERYEELDLLIKASSELKIAPELGVRMKPRAQGTGKWASSGGEHSKFGLTAKEVLNAVQEIKRLGRRASLKLFHFHIGSQIPSLKSLEEGVREASALYVEAANLCPSLCFFDIGGGLAVDYTGTENNFDFSANYKIQEYAKCVVSVIKDACDKASILHPQILSESGRALASHHSVLITEIFSASYSRSGSYLFLRPKTQEKSSDLYFANFSLFQSLPDIWAIQQMFPVVPIHRLNEQTTRHAAIVDLTCDSDGKIERFMRKGKLSYSIPLHHLDSAPYYVGVFLTGAYQEILGNRHNLFGPTNVISVDLDKKGDWKISDSIRGSTVKEMMHSIQYDSNDLLIKMDSPKIKKRFKKALNAYTYLKG